MTDKDTLMNLIDAYAETRHRCGGIYNARTEAARKAVIEALSGMQALSAAPPALPPYPPLPMQFACSGVFAVYSADQMRAYVDADRAARAPADSVAAPAIGDELRDTLVAVSAAIAERDDRAAQKMIGEILAASPTPPAEQATTTEAATPKAGVTTGAALGGVYAELPRAGAIGYASVVDVDSYVTRMTIGPRLPGVRDIALWTTDQLRDFADRTHALRMQAAPKAAPTRTALPEGWTDCTIEFDNDGPEVVAYGPKRMMTRLAKWLGKYFAQVIAEAAPKAAPGEQNVPAEWLEQAYREGWAACRDAETIGEEAEDWAFGNSTANSRMIDAQQAAPQQEVQEPVTWESTTPGYIKYITQARYEKFSPAVRRWYKPYKCSNCSAPQPAPAPLSDDVVKDAARYRWLRATTNYVTSNGERIDVRNMPEKWDAAIDAALAAQKGTP